MAGQEKQWAESRQKNLEDLKITKILGALTHIEVSVGLHRAEGEKLAEGSNSTIAQIAYWNEFGTTRIPARPAYRQFLESDTVTDSVEWFADDVKGVTDEAAIDQALGRLGQDLAQGLWWHVNNFTTPPNAEATVKFKGMQDPLVDTGRTRDSISYEIKRNGKRIKKERARGSGL